MAKIDELEEFCINKGLVLREAIKEWKSEGLNLSFKEYVVRHVNMIRESAWIEILGGESRWPSFWPSGDPEALPRLAKSSALFGILEAHCAVLLQVDPYVIAGMLDPASEPTIRYELSQVFPSAEIEVRLLSPHMVARYLSRTRDESSDNAERGWSTEQLETWCRDVDIQSSGIEKESEIIGAIWRGYGIDTLPYGYLFSALPIEGLDRCLHLQKSNTMGFVGLVKVSDPGIKDECMKATGLKIQPFAISPFEHQRVLDLIETRKSEAISLPKQLVTREWVIDEEDPDLLGSKLFQQIMNAACLAGASDVHLEPDENNTRVRFRINGDLIMQAPLKKSAYAAVIKRIKVQGIGMNQTIKNVPQDGSCSFETSKGETVELRIATIPVAGYDQEEFAVMRILTRNIPKLSQLRMEASSRRAIDWFLGLSQGMFIICGPTGSGKTTTLYACLRYENKPCSQVITLENPPEKKLPGAVQIEVRDDGYVNFQNAMKSIVRLDPDILMVGEMRDPLSAKIGIDCALSGHKVYSTIHTMDAVGIIDRLKESFGIDYAVIRNTLRLGLAQRLVRLLCPHCVIRRPMPSNELRHFPNVFIKDPVSAESKGCPACNGTGFSGQVAIAEVLIVDDVIGALLEQGKSLDDIRKANRERGYPPLAEIVTRMAMTGEISVEEAKLHLVGLRL